MSSVRRVAVIGAGTIGASIAVDLALAGTTVTTWSRSPAGADHARERVRRLLDPLVGLGVATTDQVERARVAIRCEAALDAALADADHVVETVPEDLDLKRRLLPELERLVRDDVVLASGTTALPVTAIAAACARPDRVLATNWSLPAHLLPVVTVIPGERTSPEAIAATRGLLTACGKEPVVLARDSPGGIGPRLLMALMGEAFRLLADGVADARTIDRVITGGIGRRLGMTGVFDRADLAGLDTVAATLARRGAPVPAALTELVAAGAVGRRAGRGFHDWSPEHADAFDRAETAHLAAMLLRDRDRDPGSDSDRDDDPAGDCDNGSDSSRDDDRDASPGRGQAPGRSEEQALVAEPSPVAMPAPLVAAEVGPDVLTEFLERAREEYRRCTPTRPPRCFAILFGCVTGGLAEVRAARFAGVVRDDDPSADRVWSETIVPRFGDAYANDRRGWWADSRDVLAIHRAADAEGLDIIGSIHLHPDWHRIGPEPERCVRISAEPTPMDRYLFAGAGWPLNMICYLERAGSGIDHTVAAWSPPPVDDPGGPCARIPVFTGRLTIAPAPL